MTGSGREKHRMELPLAVLIFVYLALGGAAFGLLEFGVGALLWADSKLIMALGLVAALSGLYLALFIVFHFVTPYLT